jgi:hypothetical protein
MSQIPVKMYDDLQVVFAFEKLYYERYISVPQLAGGKHKKGGDLHETFAVFSGTCIDHGDGVWEFFGVKPGCQLHAFAAYTYI